MGVINFSIPKDLVLKITNNFDIQCFVETGTYKGETCFWAAKYFEKVYTIEIDPEISHETSSRKECPSNIEFIVGNSKDILPTLVSKLSENSFFWLDGHWCVGGGGNEEECPLLDELKALAKLKNPTIFIDDARCFMGPLPLPHNSNHWPRIDTIFLILRNYFPNHLTTIQDDVIMCLPEDVKKIVDTDWQEKFNQRFYLDTRDKNTNLSLTKLSGLIIKKIFGFHLYKLVKRIFISFGLPIQKRIIEKKTKKIELKEFKFSNKWIIEQKIKTIIDIGANEGQFAHKFRMLLPKAQIISFEPLPEIYNKLVQSFKGDSLFTSYNLALGDKEEKQYIWVNEYTPSSSLLEMDQHLNHFNYAKAKDKIEIQLVTLDSILSRNKIKTPYLIKMDVQGYEEKVIFGGLNLIKGASIIIIEVSFKSLYKNQVLFDRIYCLLVDLGFVYSGNYYQLYSPINNEILQADAIFMKKND